MKKTKVNIETISIPGLKESVSHISGTELLDFEIFNSKNVRAEDTDQDKRHIKELVNGMKSDSEGFGIRNSGIALLREGLKYFILNGGHTWTALNHLKGDTAITDKLKIKVAIITAKNKLTKEQIVSLVKPLNNHKSVKPSLIAKYEGVFEHLEKQMKDLGFILKCNSKQVLKSNELPLELILKLAIGVSTRDQINDLIRRSTQEINSKKLKDAGEFLAKHPSWRSETLQTLYRQFRYPNIDMDGYLRLIAEYRAEKSKFISTDAEAEALIWQKKKMIDQYIKPLNKGAIS